MACRSCGSYLELLPRLSRLIGRTRARNAALLGRPTSAASASQSRRVHQISTSRQPAKDPETPTTPSGIAVKLAQATKSLMPRVANAYQVYGATDDIYKTCSRQATYTITKDYRRNGLLKTTEDGEEIGVGVGESVWHNDLDFLPTFSTWSQVTMLHMYLIIVRLRCLEKEEFQNWQRQLVDHFFHEAEARMDSQHDMTSRSLRQKYLRDLFDSWRGLMLAYDEGLVKGDAVLASALWRNLFKGRPDVDLRVLAAVVSWMRLCLKNLDGMTDPALLFHAQSVFKWPPTSELQLVDQPAKGLEGIQEQLRNLSRAPAKEVKS